MAAAMMTVATMPTTLGLRSVTAFTCCLPVEDVAAAPGAADRLQIEPEARRRERPGRARDEDDEAPLRGRRARSGSAARAWSRSGAARGAAGCRTGPSPAGGLLGW